MTYKTYITQIAAIAKEAYLPEADIDHSAELGRLNTPYDRVDDIRKGFITDFEQGEVNEAELQTLDILLRNCEKLLDAKRWKCEQKRLANLLVGGEEQK